MAFPINVVMLAWNRAGGRCECDLKNCGHGSRCNKILLWDYRGKDYSPFGWEAHHIVSQKAGGSDTLSNCKILCCDCHKNTGSYGG